MIDPQKFPLTAQAISEIETALDHLKTVSESKKNSLSQQKQAYKRNMADKNAQIDMFATTTAKALETIGQTVRQIDEVLEENGTGHRND